MNAEEITELRLKLLAAGYDPLPCAGKAALLDGWTTLDLTPDLIRAWPQTHPASGNTGIRCGHATGIDIDVLDGGISERAKNLALQMLGDTTLVRIGRAPKQLLVYRTETPARKKSVAAGKGKGAHKIEILGEGNQFIAFGTHPDTLQPYVWPESNPLQVPLHELPLVTEEMLVAYLDAVSPLIGVPERPQAQAAQEPFRASPRANGHAAGIREPTDAEEAVEALYAIPAASLDYSEWVRVGFALHAALGPGGAAHYEAWSATDPARFKPGEPSSKFAGFAARRDINPGTLFYIAAQHGWKGNRSSLPPVGDASIFKRRPPAFDPETGEVLGDEPEPPPRLAFTRYVRINPGNIPPRRFLYGRHYIRQFLSTDISPGGIGKSSLAIADAVAMAAHKDFLGTLPTERIKVAYWNGEDPLEELQRRVEAVCLHYGIAPEETDGHLFIDSGRLLPLILAHEGRNGVVLDHAVIDAVIASIKASGINVLIIDPFIASHRVGENDNNAIELVAKAWSHIADATNCSVNLVHHSRKLNGEEVTVESGRGASALLAACRSARTLNQMTKDEASQLGVENHRLYFRVDDGKSNLQPPAEGAVWHRLVNVDLPNGPLGTVGDKVGVVTRWEKPDAMGSLTAADLKTVQNAIASGRWRDNAQARDWVGKAVAQALGFALPEEAPRVKALIKAWLKSGSLTVVTGLDAHREKRDYVEVGNWVENDT